VKNNCNVGDQIVDVRKYRLSYSLSVSAAFGTDGAGFVKKGVISSHSAVKSPVAIAAISELVSDGLVVRVSRVETASKSKFSTSTRRSPRRSRLFDGVGDSDGDNFLIAALNRLTENNGHNSFSGRPAGRLKGE
jgi:hypothetical protein